MTAARPAQPAAGRSLDADISRVVFGRDPAFCGLCPKGVDSGACGHVPRYSESIEAAMTLLDAWHGDWKIRRQNGHFKVTLYEPSMQGVEWAESLPLAICRIRLRATRWPFAVASTGPETG